MLVVDASTILAFVLEENSSAADDTIDLVQKHGAHAPVIWWYEVRNVIAISERKGRISRSDASSLIHSISRVRLEIDRETPDAIFEIARMRSITVYDAAYLELAMRRDLPLATLDASLAQAAKAEGVLLI